MNRTHLDHRLARTRVPFVVPAVPPVPTQPGERPFHHIPLRLLHEPHTPRRTADHFHHVPRLGLNQPGLESVVVVSCGSMSHWQTERFREKKALSTSRMSICRVRPTRWPAISGWTIAHSSSVRSEG